MSSPFPFHGIFSGLQSDDDGVVASALLKKAQRQKRAEEPTFEQREEPASVKHKKNGKGQLAVDIFETDDYYVIKAPIAGVHLQDLDIEVSENAVTIRGIRRQADDLPLDQYYLQECFWGEFSRTITLPFQVDPRKVKATFNKECILKVLIPKEERVRVVRINEA